MTISLGKLYALMLLLGILLIAAVAYKTGRGSDTAWIKGLGYTSVKMITQNTNSLGCGIVNGQSAVVVEFYTVSIDAEVTHVVACKTDGHKAVVAESKI